MMQIIIMFLFYRMGTVHSNFHSQPLLRTVVARIIAGGPDPDLLMQDPYFHFVHTPQDRRYTQVDFHPPFARERLRIAIHTDVW